MTTSASDTSTCIESMTLTLCPDDKHQFMNSPVRLRMVTDYIRTLLRDNLSDEYYNYTLYTEVSYPEKSQDGSIARIHYHGVIDFMQPSSKALFYIEHFHKLNKNCRMEVDDINDFNGWLDYCTKNWPAMQPYCELQKVPYKITHKLPYPSAPKLNKNISNFLKPVINNELDL